ncbi:MAG: hypothetical protein R3244_03900 [Thermoanaerobaculia bacterium]|nr:hypothetical protein [Thermoanaerobaculia bacterium]
MPNSLVRRSAPLFALVLVATIPLDAALLIRPGQPPDGEGTVVMRWSYPDRAAPDLVAWHRRHAAALAAVEHAWSRLLRRLSGQLPKRFREPCEALGERLDALDEATLLPAPDRLLDLYLKRMLWHLRRVGGQCRADQLWNVVHHLEEARTALGEVRWILEQRGFEPLSPERRGEPTEPDR